MGTISARRVSVGTLLFLAACAQGAPAVVTVKHDMAHAASQPDLGGQDLGAADLAVPTDMDAPDMTVTGDMARAWVDKSVSTSNAFFSVWGNGTGLVFAVGGGNIRYRSTLGAPFVADPSNVTTASTADLLGVSSTSTGPPNNPIFAVGGGGLIWGYSGNLDTGTGTWTPQSSSTSNTLFGVWVASDGTSFAVGSSVALKKAGGAWASIGGIGASAYNVWGWKTATGYVVYAVGAGGQIWKSTGTAFTTQTSGVSTDLIGVYGFSDTDIYAVGVGGIILHSTGNGTWTKQTSGTSQVLEGIGGPSADEVYAVGDNGVVLHKLSAAATTWQAETVPSGASAKILNGVWGTATEVYVVGQDGTILKK